MGATRSTNIELIRGAAAELHEALFVIVRQLLNPKSGVVGHDAIMAGRRALLHAGSVVDLPDYGKRQGYHKHKRLNKRIVKRREYHIHEYHRERYGRKYLRQELAELFLLAARNEPVPRGKRGFFFQALHHAAVHLRHIGAGREVGAYLDNPGLVFPAYFRRA